MVYPERAGLGQLYYIPFIQAYNRRENNSTLLYVHQATTIYLVLQCSVQNYLRNTRISVKTVFNKCNKTLLVQYVYL